MGDSQAMFQGGLSTSKPKEMLSQIYLTDDEIRAAKRNGVFPIAEVSRNGWQRDKNNCNKEGIDKEPKRNNYSTNARKTNFLSPQPKVPVIRESGRRLNYSHVQNILSGKKGTEDINLIDYRKISFKNESHCLSSEPGK